MLQSGDIILFSLLGWNFFVKVTTFLNLTTTIVLKECILQLNLWFSLRQASSCSTSYLILTISQRIQEHEESLLSSAGNKPLSRSFNMKMGPCPSTGMNMYICIYTNIILFYLNKTIDVKTNMHICTYTLLLSTLGFYVCLSFTVCFAVKISVPWFVHP